ncbi:LysM peptidoglycan-binding domain-containing protein [Streptococcus saliviloxodontae]|uniref:Chemotaxis protein histidine kinase CheA n=1 Tax=Streptococcus saliviloxodontae TaxID=1349416 RepID=A0ABS2PKB9_9STRE|nr:LysM domain-containing protein [Streptococcus saliviloxodontae]MBM7635804.1 chemotaxis protein histidine kinase CheA [Streptococcus saliviloxodontae]
MISKKISKKSLLYSTVALSLFAAGHANADEQSSWKPRSVEEIKAGLITEGNKVTYTVQYGDTLSTIAQAMNIDVNVLGNLNKITDINLIFPETVLTATYSEDNKVATVEVETPVAAQSNETVKATADLETNQVVVEDQTVSVADLTQAIVDTTTQEQEAYAQTTTPVEDAIAQATDTQASSEDQATSAVQETAASTETVETTEAPATEVTSEVTEAPEQVAEETATSEVAPTETTEISSQVEETVSPATSETATSEVAASEEAVETTEATSAETSEQTEATAASEEVVETTEATPSETSEQTEAPQETTVQELTQAIVSETTEASTYAETTEPVTEAINQVIEASEAAQTTAETTSDVSINTQNMQAPAAAFAQSVANTFGISDIGGYRAGDPQDHGQGLAVDVMVPESSALGDQVAQYAIDNMSSAGISYIIWKQRFYSPYNNIYGPANTWNPMPDRGSVTENHYDHVHVSFNG